MAYIAKAVQMYNQMEYFFFAQWTISQEPIPMMATITKKKAQSPRITAGMMMRRPTIAEMILVLKATFASSWLDG